jgi:DNA adenine methylase
MTDKPDKIKKRPEPLLKWAGGKEKELKYILPRLPATFENYFEPFVGGGSVYTAIKAEKYFINDKSEELISLYKSLINSDRNSFFYTLGSLVKDWEIISGFCKVNAEFFTRIYRSQSSKFKIDESFRSELKVFLNQSSGYFGMLFLAGLDSDCKFFLKKAADSLFRKVRRMRELEIEKHVISGSNIAENCETALKSAYYVTIRHIYNNASGSGLRSSISSAFFLFLRSYAYSGMFRYNSSGEFNVPYGGMGYNRKNFSRKISYLRSQEIRNLLSISIIENMDFELFFRKHPPGKNDFIFIDPPYDTEFSTYAQNAFSKEDQKRLSDYLVRKCQAKWMLVIKNTDFISSLYSGKGLEIESFEKKYLVSFMNRNNRNAEHLIIRNYLSNSI